MNENSEIHAPEVENLDPDPVPEENPEPAPQEEPAPVGGGTAGEDPAVADGKDPVALPDDLPKTPDPDPCPAPSGDEGETADELRRELTRLREQLAERGATTPPHDQFLQRFRREWEEFGTLYPGIPLQTLPDAVWDDVERGVPIAAAFALSERRKLRVAEIADASNRENSARTSGALSGNDPEYFSPEEVRAMSQKEVRDNYQKIMRSMQKWH